MVAGQLDRAIGELAEAARLQPDALEIELILGNLYREKGQVGRAITIHQQLLQRPKLTRLEHAYILLCLGLDYKRGGFVDRAHEAFSEVLRFEPQNPYALTNLQKLHEEQHQWPQAHEVRQRLVAVSPEAEQPRNRQILAFLENELGPRRGRSAATRPPPRPTSSAALDLDPATCRRTSTWATSGWPRASGAEAAQAWERVTEVAPERALPGVRPPRVALPVAQQPPGRFRRALPPAHPGEPEGLARAPGAGPQHHVGRAHGRRAGTAASKRSRTARTP
ncbi:MAG: hypothetical protein MZU95_03185 [Desulfomicrobium escambiense]|nr:hypothetical protein [Desulfomicrobium escambiense]